MGKPACPDGIAAGPDGPATGDGQASQRHEERRAVFLSSGPPGLLPPDAIACQVSQPALATSPQARMIRPPGRIQQRPAQVSKLTADAIRRRREEEILLRRLLL